MGSENIERRIRENKSNRERQAAANPEAIKKAEEQGEEQRAIETAKTLLSPLLPFFIELQNFQKSSQLYVSGLKFCKDEVLCDIDITCPELRYDPSKKIVECARFQFYAPLSEYLRLSIDPNNPESPFIVQERLVSANEGDREGKHVFNYYWSKEKYFDSAESVIRFLTEKTAFSVEHDNQRKIRMAEYFEKEKKNLRIKLGLSGLLTFIFLKSCTPVFGQDIEPLQKAVPAASAPYSVLDR